MHETYKHKTGDLEALRQLAPSLEGQDWLLLCHVFRAEKAAKEGQIDGEISLAGGDRRSLPQSYGR